MESEHLLYDTVDTDRMGIPRWWQEITGLLVLILALGQQSGHIAVDVWVLKKFGILLHTAYKEKGMAAKRGPSV